MVVFPNSKINLGLNIISKRDDGYHNIESCFYPVKLSDVLEILPSSETTFTSTGIAIPNDPKGNLCLRAYELLKADYSIDPVQIHLHKVIPIGAGLGGGSSDAAFTLKVLNELFQLALDDNELEGYAAKLGSDCPFFVKNKPVIARGTGTDFTSIDLDLSGYEIKIKFPDIHIGTAEAYSGIVPRRTEIKIEEIIAQPISKWKDTLENNFEDSIFPNHPEIASIKKEFYEQGAVYASMTGSGSAVYGIFNL